MLDFETHMVVTRGRAERLREDFLATGEPVRVTVGKRLVRLGLRLAGAEFKLVRRDARLRSEAVP